MATRAMFPAGVFSVGGAAMEDEGPNLSDLPGNNLPVPQLVLLASPARPPPGSGSTGEDGASCDGLVEEKEMVELKTVGCSYSDSEGESVRYSYDQQNRVEFCIVEYVDSPGPRAWTPAPGSKVQDDREEEQEEEQEANEREGATVKDLSKPPEPRAPDTPGLPAAKRKSSHAAVVESTKKKKPFHCKPCNYQADSEEAFVEHLGTHALSKRVVLNRVEGRSKARAAQAGGTAPPPEAGGAEGGAGDMGDSKGVIRCERCGYNTNRYDHYVAHLKHHSKEGEDQRVFKCTLCPYTTVSQYHWRKHLRNHFPSKLHTCDQCSYFSDRKSNYIQHIRKHTGMRPFRCPYCEYSSSQKTHLTRHMRTHSGERPFKCDSCNYLAANQHEVTRHARQVHNGPKPLACPYCQYKTADRSNFKKHVELHLNPRQFHCPLCKYAASKKCNLQYHIKSRHVGCDIPIDVSKVKLRVKKGSEDAADHLGRSKSNKGKSLDDEEDGDDFESDEGELASKQAPTPISLSSKKSGEHTQVPENDVETDRVQKKAKTAAALKDKGAPGSKEKVVGKVTTRQKKVARVSENTKEKCSIEEGPVETPAAPVRSREAKVKRCTKKKKLLLKEKSVSSTDGLEGTDPEGGDEPANPNGEQAALQRSMEEMKKLQKEKRIEKMRKAKQEKDEPKTSFKTNKRIHARRTGARKPNKDSEPLVEDVPHGPEVSPGDDRQLGKVKVGKRKAIEALDLSTKHSSAEAPTVEYPSPKKSKTITADKPATKPSSSQEVSQTAEPCPALEKDLQMKAEAPNPVKLKKTRKICKKKPVLQESPVSTKDQQDSVTEDPFTPPAGVSSTQLQSDMTQPPPDTHPEQNPTEAQVELHHNKMAPQESTSSAPEKKARQISRATEVASTSRGSGEEKTLCPVTDRHTAPLFRRPGAKAPRPSLEIPRPAEEDEGIHSSHEGTSDASDSASEGGSEDSGLNSAGAGSGKMPNDPETPTDEIPTPTELKSHLCVFCDRTFPLEVEYRRHVNRHLVNVYDRDSPAANTGK